MNSIKTIIIAATLSALSLGAAQAAETIVQAASFHAGTHHAVRVEKPAVRSCNYLGCAGVTVGGIGF